MVLSFVFLFFLVFWEVEDNVMLEGCVLFSPLNCMPPNYTNILRFLIHKIDGPHKMDHYRSNYGQF